MDFEGIKQQKKEYRRRVQEALKLLSPDEVARQSSIITSKALALPEYRNAESLSVFLSMPGKEVSTRDIVKQAFKDGKIVYVPYIHVSITDSKLKVMDMLRLRNEEDLNSLQPDAWGIPSLPKESIDNRENALGGMGCLEVVDKIDHGTGKLDLIFMPSMAFDSSLNRLGHGDRDGKVPHLVGLALKEQILASGEALPTNEQDWKVDQIISPNS